MKVMARVRPRGSAPLKRWSIAWAKRELASCRRIVLEHTGDKSRESYVLHLQEQWIPALTDFVRGGGKPPQYH